jgi:hypothetical protein
MPKWWPWGRSKRPDPELAAPATRPEPAWHRLPAVQPTVGGIDSTVFLQGFTESLTTSQKPGITGSLELLSTGHADRLSVLDVAHHSSGAAARPTNAPVAPAPQSRTWAPSPMAVQRALRSTATVQRADEIPPVREIHSVEAASDTAGPLHSMVQAHPPDDRRILGVADEQEFEANEPQSMSAVAPEPASIDHHSSTVTEDPVSQAAQPTPSPASAPPAVQRLSSSADRVPAAAPQAVSANSLGSADTSLTPPPRHLPSLQRAATGSDTPPQWFTAGRPIPVLRTIDAPGSQPAPRKPDTVTPKTVGDSGNAVQRWIDPGPTRAATTAATTPLPPDPAPPSTPSESDGELPVVRTAETKQSTTAPPPVTAQRVMTNTEERDPAPRTGNSPAPEVVVQSLPDVIGQSLPAVKVQRLPMSEARPDAAVAGAAPERRTPTMPAVQRASSVVAARPLPERSTHTLPEVHVEADETPGPWDSWGDSTASGRYPHESASQSEATRILQALPHAAEHATPTTPQSSVMQRVASPVVEPTSALHRTGSPATQSHSDSTVSPVVQRAAATGRRLVVLPPLRPCATNPHDGPDSSQGAPERSILVDSPRPVGLQRMFGDNAMRTDSGTGFRAASSGSAGSASAAFSPGESSSDSASGVPQFETSGPSYDPSTNTIMFASPTVQREPEAAPPPESVSAAAQAPSTPSGPAPSGPAAASPAGGVDVEELVNKLYDPLAARLRAELWLDRERAGVLMDLGR